MNGIAVVVFSGHFLEFFERGQRIVEEAVAMVLQARVVAKGNGRTERCRHYTWVDCHGVFDNRQAGGLVPTGEAIVNATIIDTLRCFTAREAVVPNVLTGDHSVVGSFTLELSVWILRLRLCDFTFEMQISPHQTSDR